MMETMRSKEKLNTAVNNYLERKGIFDESPPWIIKESSLGGFGVFTSRDTEKGEIIFRDYPVILGPRCLEIYPRICVICYSKSNLKKCSKGCGLLVCSDSCEKTRIHESDCDLIGRFRNENNSELNTEEVMKCLAPLRSLLLGSDDKDLVCQLKAHEGSRHGYEVEVMMENLKFNLSKGEEDFSRLVCSVMDANAFEVLICNEGGKSSLRGLYPLGSLANHRCYPNVYHVFDDENRMVVRAGVQMKKDTEILHSYSRIIWGTTARKFHLSNTKHFVCNCERCLDPTEFGTYMSSIYCKDCRGKVVPLNPVKRTNWQCEDCKRVVTLREVAQVLSLVGSILTSFGDTDFEIMYKFLTGKLTTLVPEYSQVTIEIKYQIIWILGYKSGYLWADLTKEQLEIKKMFCQDILKLLDKLNVGLCKIRGLILYEMYLCIEEASTRETVQNGHSDSASCIFEETSDILRYDTSAPEKIKNIWRSNSKL